MKYISTRGKAPALNFEDVLLTGLAPDGGLYVPETLPQFSREQIAAWSSLSYTDLAFEIVQPFVAGSIPDADLKAIAARLHHRPFLFGNAPTAADFSVAPMLDALRRTPVATRLTKRVAQDQILTAYLDRIEVAVPLSAAPPIAAAA